MTAYLRIKPRLGPRLVERGTAELDAIMKPERTVVPKLELEGRDAPAAPAGRTRHLADHVFGGNDRDCLLEGEPAFQRLRLLAGPSPDLRLLRSRREVGIRFRGGHRRHIAADAHLPAQRLPVKQQ